MKKMLMAAAALAAASLFAQGAGPQGGMGGEGPGRGRPGGGMIRKTPPAMGARHTGADAGAWLAGFLAQKENLEKLGVSNAADRVRIQDGLAKLRAKSEEIEKKIRKISREQSAALREILADRKNDGAKLLEKVDEVSRLRAEQGRIAVESIVLLRNALPDGKEAEALEMLSEFGKRRGMMRRRRGTEMGEEKPGEGRPGEGREGMNRNRGRQERRGKPGGMRGDRPGKQRRGGESGMREGGDNPPPPPPQDGGDKKPGGEEPDGEGPDGEGPDGEGPESSEFDGEEEMLF